jgi:hypothetical protein
MSSMTLTPLERHPNYNKTLTTSKIHPLTLTRTTHLITNTDFSNIQIPLARQILPHPLAYQVLIENSTQGYQNEPNACLHLQKTVKIVLP